MVTIREATPIDVDVIYDLIIAIAKYHGEEHYVITNKTELAASGFGSSPKFGVLLAEVNGEIAGYASYTWNYNIWLGTNYMHIDDVFVWDSFRGHKVGEALKLKAKDVCFANGCRRLKWEVEEDNLSAIRCYERLGAEVNIKGVCRWGDALPAQS
ncbi:MAG: GNAT family N-acetyltransferase [Psychrosphaera sp.]|nr:GNAT family N-acetyltransferase [Psychrosphaera sp.]